MKPDDITRVKSIGFLLNRGTENFSGRIVAEGTVFSAEDLQIVAEIAKRFGNGKISFTSRQTAEIIGIPYDKIEAAIALAEEHGLFFGGTGAKVRPITACKGTTCVFGNFDTQKLAALLHQQFYIGWQNVKLPHKFKIGIGGCPNSCMKPSLNDFGVESHCRPQLNIEKCRGCKVCNIEKSCPMKAVSMIDSKVVINNAKCNTCGVCTTKCPFGAVLPDSDTSYQIFVGGTWGKHTRMGTALSHQVSEKEIVPLLEKTILWFKENAYQKERLGAAIDRIGFSEFEKAISGDDLLKRKEQILAIDQKYY